MRLHVVSPEGTMFEGTIQKVTVPTEVGDITILPQHQPLSSVVKTGILRVYVDEEKQGDRVVYAGAISISLSKGILLVQDDTVIITTSAATTSPAESEEVLEQMRQDMAAQLEKIKVEGSVEDFEKAMMNLEKVTADLRLAKLQHMSG